jgi:polysaccharide export outer membrane protein
MEITVRLGVLLLGLAAWSAAYSADPPNPNLSGYRLHAGDKIVVGLYDDLKLPPREIVVAPDGTFSFPMIGEVQAGGKTAAEIRMQMEAKLKKYVTEPVVTFAVTQVNGNVAYVVGQVNKPGQLIMNPGLNVLQAISMAGGGNPYAKLDSIIVIRGSGGAQQVLPFRYGQVSAGKNLEQNVELQSGDVVVVP